MKGLALSVNHLTGESGSEYNQFNNVLLTLAKRKYSSTKLGILMLTDCNEFLSKFRLDSNSR